MKKRFFNLIILCLILPISGFSDTETSFKLEEFFKFPHMAVSEESIYVWDEPFNGIYVYSRSPFALSGKFSQKGQGPGDFVRIYNLIIGSKWVFIESADKVAYYSFSGKMIKEVKKNPGHIGIVPIGANFVCRDWTPLGIAGGMAGDKRTLSVVLLNSAFKSPKVLHQFEIISNRDPVTMKTRTHLIEDCRKHVVHNEKIFIGDTAKGLPISVLNEQGKKLCEIKGPQEKRKISNDDKHILTEKLKDFYGPHWGWWQSQCDLVFPEYYPSYLTFSVSDNKIYFMMYPDFSANTQKIRITDERGVLLKEREIDALDLDAVKNDRFCIHGGVLYYLEEDSETGSFHIRLRLLH